MTDASGAEKKTNKWLWPLLAALALVAVLAWAFNRGADDGDLSERMASDPVSRQDASGADRGAPNPPAPSAAALVPDNADGNASVITEADAARVNGGTGAPNDGVAGSATAPTAAGQTAPAPSGSDGRPTGQ